MDKNTHWSLARQFISNKSDSIQEVMNRVVGVYSTHPSGPLSLFARIYNLTQNAYFEYENEKLSTRIPCMRTSVHFVPTEFCDKVFTATLPDPATGYWVKQYEVKGKNLMDKDYQKWTPFIQKFAKKPVSIKEMKEELDIPNDMMKFVVNRMAFEGKIVRVGSGSVTSNIISYINTNNWTNKDLYNRDRNSSLRWLAQKYLKAFGPARIRDFQWWSGCKVTEAKQAIAENTVEQLDDDLFLLSDDLEEYRNFNDQYSKSIHILPQWDSYTMGYAPDGRQRFVSNDYLKDVYGSIGATGGNAFGVIIVDGMVTGIWKPKFLKKVLEVTITSFDKDLASNEELNQKMRKIANFLGAEDLEVKST